MFVRNRGRRGFTLLEVLMALAVSGVVILAAHQLFGVVADVADRVPALAATADSARNRERLLRELLSRVETGTDSTRRFRGEPSAARFESWCAAPGGWLARCTVEVVLLREEHGARLEVRWPGRHMTVMTGSMPAGLLYLKSAAAGGTWLPQWGDALTAPLALMAIVGRDTLFLRIGERG